MLDNSETLRTFVSFKANKTSPILNAQRAPNEMATRFTLNTWDSATYKSEEEVFDTLAEAKEAFDKLEKVQDPYTDENGEAYPCVNLEEEVLNSDGDWDHVRGHGYAVLA